MRSVVDVMLLPMVMFMIVGYWIVNLFRR